MLTQPMLLDSLITPGVKQGSFLVNLRHMSKYIAFNLYVLDMVHYASNGIKNVCKDFTFEKYTSLKNKKSLYLSSFRFF